jgi:hypothetical protein
MDAASIKAETNYRIARHALRNLMQRTMRE